MRGRINWYDAESGRGSIISDDNIWYRIHEFTMGTRAEWTPGTPVEFELASSSIHPIVTVVKA